MATPSKTIQQLEYEQRQKDRDPIGYAIREHERNRQGFLNFFHGNAPSKTLPPRKIN